MEIQALTSVFAGDLRVAGKLISRRLQFFDLCIEKPQTGKPIIYVPPAIAPRHAPGVADGEIDFPSALIKFLGDLGARLTCSDHKDGPRRERRRIAVLHRVNL